MNSRSPKTPHGFSSGEELMLTTTSQTDKFSLMSEESLSRRQVHLIDTITESTFEQVKNVYDQLVEMDSTAPIHFIVGTIGGDVRSMLGIMNLFALSKKNPCYTYLFGETCSAGAWIYLAGHKRFAPKTDLISIMFHPMEWNYEDSLGNQASQNKYVTALSNNLLKFALGRTKISERKLRQLATNETRYFVGDELFEFGIATDELTDASFWLKPPVIKEVKEDKKKATKSKTVLLENNTNV